MSEVLNFANHDRLFNHCEYIYPVVSRRSEGVSLGINLNLNRTCNWRCVYCQVENLVRGKPMDVNLPQLERELEQMLDWILYGNFMELHVAPDLRRLNDICIAGNGEPTLSPQFSLVCDLIKKIRDKYSLGSETKTILITNGSEVLKPMVQDGIAILKQCNGEVWFKIDRITPAGALAVNQVHVSAESVAERLSAASRTCRTYIQSCWFKTNGNNPGQDEIDSFITFLKSVHLNISGILLYSVARTPALAEGGKVSSLEMDFLEDLAQQISQCGYPVKFYL